MLAQIASVDAKPKGDATRSATRKWWSFDAAMSPSFIPYLKAVDAMYSYAEKRPRQSAKHPRAINRLSRILHTRTQYTDFRFDRQQLVAKMPRIVQFT